MFCFCVQADPGVLLSQAKDGNLDGVKQAIAAGVEVNAKDKLAQNTALILSAQNGHAEVVTYLLENGADPNIQNRSGNAVIHLAALQNQPAIIRLLLDHKVDIESQNQEQKTAFALAARRANYDLMEQLLNWGAKIDCEDGLGRTPLMIALERDHVELTRRLVEMGADVTHFDKFGRNPLMYCHNVNLAIFLTQQGAKLDFVRDPGPHPLTEYIKRGDLRMVKWIIGANCDINAKDEQGWPALTIARRLGNTEVAGLLLEKGAAELDFEKNKDLAILYFAGKGDLVRVSELKDQKVSIDGKDTLSTRPLIEAVLNNQQEMVTYILDLGANPDLPDGQGNTALMIASAKGYGPIVEFLLARGADPFLQNKAGLTAYQQAMDQGTRGPAITALKKAGADTFTLIPCCQDQKKD